MKMRPLLEKEIQRQILDYLEIKGIFHFRNNVGAGKLAGGRFVRFGIPGAPDILALKNGIFYGIEVKRPGKKLSPLQEEFRDSMVRHGGKHLVAFNLESVMEIL